jgi:hypothetical protein
VENLLWKTLQTRVKTDYGMNEYFCFIGWTVSFTCQPIPTPPPPPWRLWPEDRSLLIHGSVWGWNVFNLSSSPLTSYVQQRRLRQTHIAWIRNDYTTLSVGFVPRSGATFRQSKQRYSLARSSASAAVYLNVSVFSVIKQRRLVKHRRFGKTYRSHLQGSYLHSHEQTT